MKCIKKLKLISKAFNSSMNVDEFKVNLDLNCISIDEATKIYSNDCKDIIQHMESSWCDKGGKISWKKMFKHTYNGGILAINVPYALPYAFEMKSCNGRTKYTMNAIAPNEKDMEMHASLANDSVRKMQSMDIDMASEMFNTLIHELTIEMHI